MTESSRRPPEECFNVAPGGAPAIELKTLGQFQLGALRRVKPLLALTYLALEGATSRRKLAELLWPGAPQPDNNLRVALHAVRDVQPDILSGETALTFTASCDAVRLLGLTGLDAYTAYPAPFLQGVKLSEVSAEFEEWLLTQRERLAQHVQFQILAHAERSDPTGAAHWAEIAYRLPGAAPADVALLERLLVLSLPGSALETELKTDLQSFPEVPAGERLPQWPRPQRKRLLGRVAEMDTLIGRAVGSSGSLTLISGPGGIGKSTLGRELLRELKVLGFGVTYLDAESLRTRSELLTALGLASRPDYGSEISLPALRSLLGPRPAVLLDGMDGMNQLPEVLSELRLGLSDVHWFVTCRRNLLWRSRTELAAASQDHFALPLEGLSLPSPDADLDEILGSPSVQLFAQEAQRSVRDFRVSGHNAALVVGVTRRLRGHPLALTMAASWLRLEPLDGVFSRILQGAAQLHDAADPGRRSLLLVAQRSWEVLDRRAQETLLRLSVFRDFDPRDAAALRLGEQEIDSLLEQSFLEAYQPGSERLRLSPALEGVAQHFALQVPDLIAAAQADHAAHYLSWFAAQSPTAPAVGHELGNIVLAMHTGLRAGTLGAESLHRLLAYYDRRAQADSGTDTFHGLCDAAEDYGAPAEVQAAAQIACMWLAYRADRLLDAQTLALRFLASELATQPVARMKALNTLAAVRKGQGQYALAADLTHQALDIAGATGDITRQIMYSMNLVDTLLTLEQVEQAARLLETALELNRQADFASVNVNAVWYALELPEPEYRKILEQCDQCLKRARDEGDLLSELWVTVYMGLTYLGLGQPRPALDLAAECLKLAQRTEATECLIYAHYLTGQALYALGRAPQARNSIKSGLRLALDLHSPSDIAEGLLIVAEDLMPTHAAEVREWLAALAGQPLLSSRSARRARALLPGADQAAGPFFHEQVARQLLAWL